MNFLILSVTAGEGHNSTAKALRRELEAIGAECTVLDTLDYISPELAKIISKGYLLVTEHATGTYRVGYQLAENRRAKREPNILNTLLSAELAPFINSDSFDAIVFTHPFAGIFLSVLKKRGEIPSSVPTVGILTDFTFHPYWEDCTDCDFVVVPDSLLLPQARRKGFADSQIIPLGIPINPKFRERIPQRDARSKLGLNPELATFLIMGGSMGYGNIGETVRRIDESDFEHDFQLIAVCGNNREMQAEVSAIAEGARHRILVTGFVDYVPLIMNASDAIITKPGGLTTSESLACGLPMIIVNPIPGQEERNTEFLLNSGCAMATSKTCPIEECMHQLLTSPERIAAMRSCIAKIAKPNSSADLRDFLVELAHTPTIE